MVHAADTASGRRGVQRAGYHQRQCTRPTHDSDDVHRKDTDRGDADHLYGVVGPGRHWSILMERWRRHHRGISSASSHVPLGLAQLHEAVLGARTQAGHYRHRASTETSTD